MLALTTGEGGGETEYIQGGWLGLSCPAALFLFEKETCFYKM